MITLAVHQVVALALIFIGLIIFAYLLGTKHGTK